jgi:hypothetical protein
LGYAVVQCISRTKRSAPNSRQTRCLHQPASSLSPRPSGAEPLNPRSGHAAATAVRRALRPAELPVTFTTVSGTACLRAFRRALALQASAIVATPIAACNPYPYISHHAAHVYSRPHGDDMPWFDTVARVASIAALLCPLVPAAAQAPVPAQTAQNPSPYWSRHGGTNDSPRVRWAAPCGPSPAPGASRWSCGCPIARGPATRAMS